MLVGAVVTRPAIDWATMPGLLAAAGMVNDVVTVPELALEVLAPDPNPRRANAVQMARWYAPPVRFWSAWRIASRAAMNDGLAGWSFSASITSCKAILFPSLPGPPPDWYPVVRSGSNPRWSIISQFMSHRADAQISPA